MKYLLKNIHLLSIIHAFDGLVINRLCFCAFTFLMCYHFQVQAQPELTKSNKIKAAYIFNFTKYIEWPESQFANENTPITICIDSSDEFSRFMGALVKQRTVGRLQRSLQVTTLSNANLCHLAFIQNTVTDKKGLLSDAVTVSDAEHTNVLTSIIFFRQNGKLRFEINMRQIERLNISVSSELLKLARVK